MQTCIPARSYISSANAPSFPFLIPTLPSLSLILTLTRPHTRSPLYSPIHTYALALTLALALLVVLQIADQLLERADTLHARHLIHRDIKPVSRPDPVQLYRVCLLYYHFLFCLRFYTHSEVICLFYSHVLFRNTAFLYHDIFFVSSLFVSLAFSLSLFPPL